MIKYLIAAAVLTTQVYGQNDLYYSILNSDLDDIPKGGKEIYLHKPNGFLRSLEVGDKVYSSYVTTNEKKETIKVEMKSGDNEQVFEVKDGFLLYDNKKINLKNRSVINFPAIQLDLASFTDGEKKEYYSIRTDTLKPYIAVAKKIESEDTNILAVQMTFKGIIASIAKFIYFFKSEEDTAYRMTGDFLSGAFFYELELTDQEKE